MKRHTRAIQLVTKNKSQMNQRFQYLKNHRVPEGSMKNTLYNFRMEKAFSKYKT